MEDFIISLPNISHYKKAQNCRVVLGVLQIFVSPITKKKNNKNKK